MFNRIEAASHATPFWAGTDGLGWGRQLSLLDSHQLATTGAIQMAAVESLQILTDLPEYPFADRVFPIFDDEALVLADIAIEILGPRGPSAVLDVGTGSGVIAFRLAQHGHAVVGVDINPRSVFFARTNAKVNALRQVRLRRGDLYQPVAGLTFDLIVSNPPFLAVPPRADFHLAGNGGTDGTRFIRRLVRRASRFMNDDGRLLFAAVTLSRRGYPLVVELVSSMLSGLNVRFARLYPDELSLDEFQPLFSHIPSSGEWLASLRECGFDSLQYVVVEVGRGRSCLPPVRELEVTKFSGGWKQRMRRYRLWLNHDEDH